MGNGAEKLRFVVDLLHKPELIGLRHKPTCLLLDRCRCKAGVRYRAVRPRRKSEVQSRLAGGYCLRTAAQGVCAYTNICEHCPNFCSKPAMLAVLSAQRIDAQALAADAQRRGWNDEAKRHTALVDRLDSIIARAS